MDIDAIVIGCGIIGLSVSYELLSKGKSVYILEKEESCGRGISSRNSEVIHAGIYYPPQSLKAKMCVEGKHLLYEFLEKHNLPYQRCGKYIVSVDKDGDINLEQLKENANMSGVEDIEFVNVSGLEDKGIKGTSALFSPSSGIFNVHDFMNTMEYLITENGGEIVYGVEVTGIERIKGGFKVYAKDTDGEMVEIESEIVVNAAGLNSGKISGFVHKEYKIYPCKGTYFALHGKRPSSLNELVYPIPEKKGTGLGIHLTIDTGGRMKLGPDTQYIEKEDYSVDESKLEVFYKSVKTFLPWIEKENLMPDMAGIRPKLQGPDDDFKDYVIENIDGFINLVGIESPGLTASLAIGKYVSQIL